MNSSLPFMKMKTLTAFTWRTMIGARFQYRCPLFLFTQNSLCTYRCFDTMFLMFKNTFKIIFNNCVYFSNITFFITEILISVCCRHRPLIGIIGSGLLKCQCRHGNNTCYCWSWLAFVVLSILIKYNYKFS